MPDVETEPVGAVIRRFRKSYGLSLSALARAAGISKGSLHAVEAGDQDMTITRLRAVAGALDVPPAALIDSVRDGEEWPRTAWVCDSCPRWATTGPFRAHTKGGPVWCEGTTHEIPVIPLAWLPRLATLDSKGEGYPDTSVGEF